MPLVSSFLQPLQVQANNMYKLLIHGPILQSAAEVESLSFRRERCPPDPTLYTIRDRCVYIDVAFASDIRKRAELAR
ncbi:unnamed protein product [Sphenostylis stenocarpa]|uniref:Uncharacterized protein n=1 Tax=Sphenostylis stenocarpa TaxID=92480 RepID=A0AA86T3U4_9FABA|nr:unnamed protein product [Sphenostylis stenocarpa]